MSNLLSNHVSKIDEKSDSKTVEKACHKICQDRKECFKQELGGLKDFEFEVKFKPEAAPIFVKARTVPFSIQEDLNQALDAGIKKGIWSPTHFNDYGTPIVPIRMNPRPGEKKADFRICGDYSVTLNSQLEPHRYPMPLPEDLMRKLGGSRYFSKIDLAEVFNQIKLAPMSQKKLALTTNRRVLLQTRLPFGIISAPPFGIISAPGYFQEIMDKLTCDLQGVAVYLDDILVGGSNSKEHLQNLKALLQRLRDKGLRCNKNKCIFAKDSIEYLGLVISKSGIEKGKLADALTNMPRPTNISTL